jgi:hypothetical protein
MLPLGNWYALIVLQNGLNQCLRDSLVTLVCLLLSGGMPVLLARVFSIMILGLIINISV